MTIAVPQTLNTILNQMFSQEFTPEKPSENKVLSKVNSLALNCLYTGVLICQSPKQVYYRQIPQKHLPELRIAVADSNDSNIKSKIQQIIQEMRATPDSYFPNPFYTIPVDLKNCSFYVFSKVLFNTFRENYSLDDQGMPNTPLGIIDIVFSECDI